MTTIEKIESQIQATKRAIAEMQAQIVSLEEAKTELLSSQFQHTLHFSGNDHVFETLEFSDEAVVNAQVDEDHWVEATIFTNSKEDLAVFTAWQTSL